MDPERSLVAARMTPAGFAPSDIALLVPTRNAARSGFWTDFLQAVARQTLQTPQRLVADSDSRDETVAMAQAAGWDTVPVWGFNHGTTRNHMARHYPKAQILVFLTQDAVFAEPDSLEKLLRPLQDPRVAAVTARQLPRPGAGLLEAQARRFNYPETSRSTEQKDIARLGIKAAFVSNSCCAWRREALEAIGGFPETLMGEDTLAGARLLERGWKLAYAANATVFHSHAFTLVAESRRYFDIGVAHADFSDYLRQLGSPEREGLRFVRDQLRVLGRERPVEIPAALLRIASKYTTYRLGRHYRRLPHALCRYLSGQPHYWTTSRTST